MMLAKALPLVVCLGVALGVAAPADAKPCKRLCKRDLKQCKRECTGSRKEKKLCKRQCRPALMALCGVVTEPACTPPIGPCGPASLNCKLLALIAPGLNPNMPGNLPADFPPPAPTDVLCGSATETQGGATATIIIYETHTPADQVVSYYDGAFAGRGYQFTEVPDTIDADRRSCDRGFRATRNGDLVAGVYLLAQQGLYVIGLGSGGPVGPPVRR